MEIAFEVIIVILPVIISGIFTFFITKYTYNKNIPLEKLEIAYNRVYYPICRIISNNDTDNIGDIIDKIKIYFIKYDKYIDISTKRLFVQLSKCNKETKRKNIYKSFKDNINNRNSFLRRKLGYLEPSLIQRYSFSTDSEKSAIRIGLEICIIYISLILYTIAVNIQKVTVVYIISLAVFIVFLMILAFEIIGCILRTVYYRIRK